MVQQQEDLTRLFDGIKPIGRTEHNTFDVDRYTYNVFNRVIDFDGQQMPGQSRLDVNVYKKMMTFTKKGNRGYITSKTGKTMTYKKRCHLGTAESAISQWG